MVTHDQDPNLKSGNGNRVAGGRLIPPRSLYIFHPTLKSVRLSAGKKNTAIPQPFLSHWLLEKFFSHCLQLKPLPRNCLWIIVFIQSRIKSQLRPGNTAHTSNKCNKETNEQQVALKTALMHNVSMHNKGKNMTRKRLHRQHSIQRAARSSSSPAWVKKQPKIARKEAAGLMLTRAWKASARRKNAVLRCPRSIKPSLCLVIFSPSDPVRPCRL